MSPILIVVFVLVDGLVRGNQLAWAAPWRAGLLAAIIIGGLFILWRRGLRFDVMMMGIVGVIGAMLVSDAYYHIGGFGIPAMALYIGAIAWQRIVQRDWQNDFAHAGVILAALILFVVSGMWLGRFPAIPLGAWNRNVAAGVLVVTLASVPAGGNRRWLEIGVISAAILATGSRGGMLGGAAALVITCWPQFKRIWKPLVIASPAAAAGLWMLNPVTALVRASYIRLAIEQWMASSLWFGVGPGQILVIDPRELFPQYHAHNAVVSFVTQVGLVGVGVLGVALGAARRELSHGWQRWHLAALAAVAVHSLVDEPLTWWPTGLMVALILGSRQCTSNSQDTLTS